MARSQSQSKSKGKNGVGDSVTVYFDKSDPAERRALEASQLLAAKHGRRKQLIVTLLEAVYLHYEQTGELMSSSQLIANLVNVPAGMKTKPAAFALPEPHALSLPRPHSEKPMVQLAVVADNEFTSAQNFVKGFSGSFFD